MKKIFLTLVVGAISLVSFSQEEPIGGGDINGCQFFLVDNGLSASDTAQMKILRQQFAQMVLEKQSSIYTSLHSILDG